MKQVLSILLLFAAVFNLGGYGLFMACMEESANKKLDQALNDNSYDSSTLITIKVPLKNLPYYTNSATYQRQEGRIEIAGVQYNCVKQRMYKDTLEVLCIPNNAATKLCQARNDFYKLSNDLENASKKGKPSANQFKYFSPGNYLEKKIHGKGVYHDHLSKKSTRPSILLPFYYVTVIENPPELSC